ncbi:hypothetical protein [Methylobacterium aquaticum]|uniref:hypothetical protein n=1 Tax=Methylobacterium aquaticum TaxID=270351 RepID=UPI001931B9B3|nr:hypothetical protein [Methylobacterium aquaticum]QRE74440.1 hypothetical protein F1D61_13240 [Methylobacterium aquaticum]
MLYGHQIIATANAVIALGLTHSHQSFSLNFCARDRSYLRDFKRRGGATARVSPQTMLAVRSRLAEAASLRPDLASEIEKIDVAIVRDMRVANLLGRRSYR